MKMKTLLQFSFMLLMMFYLVSCTDKKESKSSENIEVKKLSDIESGKESSKNIEVKKLSDI